VHDLQNLASAIRERKRAPRFEEPVLFETGVLARSLSRDGDAGCPPIGARIWLDSTPAEVAASGADTYWQIIFNALHEYGGYIRDRCACNLGVAPEGGVAYQAYGLPNPWGSSLRCTFRAKRRLARRANII